MSASWVIRERATGRVICETFSRRAAMAVDPAKYEAVPIRQYLVALNKALNEEPTA